MKTKFTLIELLVVIAIIGIIASLLLPSLAKSRKKSQQVVCLGKLQQLSYAIRMYADDNEQRPPSDVDLTNKRWFGKLSKNNYLPSDTPKYRTCPNGAPLEEEWQSTLAINGPLIESEATLVSDHSSESMLIMDSSNKFRKIFGSNFITEKILNSDQQERIARHDYKANTLFIDGHGEAVSATQLLSKRRQNSKFWDPEY